MDTSLPDSLAPDSAPSAPQANGKTCGANSHCLSGICADGVCCNLSCTAPCLSCVVSGKEGFCSVVPAGTKPLTSSKVCSVPPSSFCGYDGYCDGLGQCRNRLAGSICLAQKCNAADVTKVNPASICDGAGKCISLNTSYGSTPCGSYLCDTKTKACHEGCKGGGSECKKGVSCSGGKCGGQKRPLGSTCKKAGDCDSGKCVGKICCDNDCKGACSTCSLAGAEGRCVSVPTGRKPDSGKSCSVKAPCEGDGKCNGAGKCRFYTPAGTPCGTNECKDGPGDSTIKIRACDGAGKCKDKKTNCGNYVCQPKVASCFASCTSNAQCRSKKTCKGNLCL